ncbi:MAG: hypothetical protein HYU52_11795 [Acidobacteria bacterium]|nr:hypothetical protein [Acidobacteriota bacterium]
MSLRDTGWSYATRDGATRHGMELRDTGWSYATRDGAARHGMELRDTVWSYATRDGATRHGMELRDTGKHAIDRFDWEALQRRNDAMQRQLVLPRSGERV